MAMDPLNSAVVLLFLAAAMILSSATPLAAVFPNFSFSWNAPVKKNPWLPFTNLTGCRYGESTPGLGDLKQYLHDFGYLPGSANFTDHYDDEFQDAIRTYQRRLGLNVTGDLDEPTVNQIIAPRCGVADVVNDTSTTNGTATQGRNLYTYFDGTPTWPSSRRELKYAITATSAVSIDLSILKTVFASAFSRWSDVTTVTFTETDSASDADITIGFYSGAHGDGEPFDGVLGTLAHAFSPTDGRFHLDAAESWVAEGNVADGGEDAVDLESVSVHEIGHLLGLGHTTVASAIMYPTIQTRTRKVDLAEDDVAGIQKLYGSNPNYKGVTTSTSTSTSTSSQETSDGGVGTVAAPWCRWGFGWVLAAVLAVGFCSSSLRAYACSYLGRILRRM